MPEPSAHLPALEVEGLVSNPGPKAPSDIDNHLAKLALAGLGWHVDYYLDEFTFRFNRRSARSRGMLFYRLIQQAAIAGQNFS
jgi:hypothetical protein